MRILLGVVLVSGLAAMAVGPDEIRISYGLYSPRGFTIFRAETKLVEVPVVVQDWHGTPIGGLTRDDFRLLDNGREQSVATFAALGAGVGSGPGAEEPPRTIAMVFDDSAMKFDCGSIAPRPNARAIAGFILMQDAALKVLQEGLRPQDRISIIGLHGGQTTLFTSDQAALRAAIKKLSVYQYCGNGVDKLGIVSDVVDYLARMRGNRRVLVGSLGFGGSNSDLESIAQRAIRGGVTIDTLDMRGPGNLGHGSLEYLANATGGRNFSKNNDFDAGLKMLANPPRFSYLLGFTPQESEPGSYHALKVQLPSRKGLEVAARTGYYAPEDKLAGQAERPIDRELMADDARRDVAAAVTALPDKTIAGEPNVLVVAHVDIPRMTFARRHGRHEQRLEIVAALFDAKGGFVAGKEAHLDFALTDASLKDLQEGINASLTLSAPAGVFRLRCIVRQEDGKMTAHTQPVRIPGPQ